MNISIIINSILKMIRDLYTVFSEWVNNSKDANVIEWVSTVFFSAFAIFIVKIPQRVYKRLCKRQSLSNEKKYEEKFVITDTEDSSSFYLSTIIPVSIDLIGRDRDIVSIRELLVQNDIVFIHANGGVGKTAVAVKIANDIKKEIVSGNSQYHHVAWITSTGDLKSDITGLDISAANSVKTKEEKYKIVSTFLQITPTFLIIDNMDTPSTPDEINKLNTIAGKTKILITSRADIPIGKPYELKDLDSDSALLLLYRYYRKGKDLTIDQIMKQDDYFCAQNIVKAATYNALFIELIGKMAYQDHWKLDELWKELEKDIFGQDSKHVIATVHGDDGKLLGHIQKLYQISKLSAKQKEIMSFITLFPAEHSIFFDVFEWAGLETDNQNFFLIVFNIIRGGWKTIDNLSVLENLGWIVRDEEGYLIHTIIKKSLELQIGKDTFNEKKYKKLIQKLSETYRYMPGDMIYTKIRERIIIPETICGLLQSKGSRKKNTYVLYNNIGNIFINQGDYEKALQYYNMALQICERSLSNGHSFMATLYNNIALVYQKRGAYVDALEKNKKSLLIIEKKYGQRYPHKAVHYHNIASDYTGIGNIEKALEYYEEALKYYKRVLEIQKNLLRSNQSEIADTYYNMGLALFSQGLCNEAMNNREKAKDYFEKALKNYKRSQEIFEKVLSPGHSTIAELSYVIGQVYYAQAYYDNDLEKYKKALDNFENALSIFKKVFKPDHLTIAGTYYYIGQVCHAQAYYDNDLEKYENAIDNYEKALSICEKGQGTENSSIAEIYYRIGQVYHDQAYYCYDLEKYENALDDYEKALSICEKEQGTECSFIAGIYCRIGQVYHDQAYYCYDLEKYENALDNYEKALSICEKEQGKEDSLIAEIYYRIGRALGDKNRFKKSVGNHEDVLTNYENALKIYSKMIVPVLPVSAEIYSNMGWIYYAQAYHNKDVEKYKKALENYEIAQTIYNKMYGPEHPDTAYLYYGIGLVYHAQAYYNKDVGKYKKALENYEIALTICNKKLGPEHPDTAWAYDGIGEVYRDQWNYVKSLENFINALNILVNALGTEHPDTEEAFFRIGLLFNAQGYYDNALEYYRKAQVF